MKVQERRSAAPQQPIQMRLRLAKKKKNSAKDEKTVDLAENYKEELFASENELERKKKIL